MQQQEKIHQTCEQNSQPLVKFYRLGIGEMLQHERDDDGDATMQSAAPTRVAGERGGGSRDAVR